MSSPIFGEFMGTMMLIVFGDGVVANVLLNKSKGQNSGWIVITTGWAFAVMVGVFVAGAFGSAAGHLNPAVTVWAILSSTDPDRMSMLAYIPAQIAGAFIGAIIVYFSYLPHWKETTDPGLKLAVFSTSPAIRSTGANMIAEIVGTVALLLGVAAIFSKVHPDLAGGIGPFLVGMLVWGIGLSLGGPTGYAINPARDLGPRLAHAILPIPGKGSSDWGYAWIPIVAPLIGSVVAFLICLLQPPVPLVH